MTDNWTKARDKLVEIGDDHMGRRVGTYAMLKAILIQLKIISAQLDQLK